MKRHHSIQIDTGNLVYCLDGWIIGETGVSLVNASYDIEHVVYAVLCREIRALLDQCHALGFFKHGGAGIR